MIQLEERTIYTTQEAAKILKLNPVTVERQIRRGELKAIKLGKEYRLLGRDLLALFDWRSYARSAWEEVGRELRSRYPNASVVKRIVTQVRRSRAGK